jgi:hypothetical protein
MDQSKQSAAVGKLPIPIPGRVVVVPLLLLLSYMKLYGLELAPSNKQPAPGQGNVFIASQIKPTKEACSE